MAVICVFGASSTWGAWDSEKGGWVNRLRLFIKNNDYEHDVYNLGVSGDTTRDVLKRFDQEAQAREAGIVIFSLGDNDAVFDSEIGDYQISTEEHAQNIQKLIDKAKKFTDKIIFCGQKPIDESKTTPVPWHTGAHYRIEDIQKYARVLEEIVRKNGTLFLPMYTVLDPQTDLEDGLHPNVQGHEKIFQAVKNFLIDHRVI